VPSRTATVCTCGGGGVALAFPSALPPQPLHTTQTTSIKNRNVASLFTI
jgi:hypothetical protein